MLIRSLDTCHKHVGPNILFQNSTHIHFAFVRGIVALDSLWFFCRVLQFWMNKAQFISSLDPMSASPFPATAESKVCNMIGQILIQTLH